MGSVLTVKALSKKYKKHMAVNGLNMNIDRGDIYGFVGENGSGKTTVIRMITGLIFPYAGDFQLFGVDSKSPEIGNARSRIGAIVENPSIYLNMSAYDNLRTQCALLGINDNDKIRSTLADVGLEYLYDEKKKAGNFSLGMRQRLGIAMALLGDPEFLILDEPTSGLDPIGCREVKDLILTLKKRGKTILVTSHLLSDIEDICDRVVILYGGKIRAEGELNELLKISGTDTITVPHLNGEQMKKVLAACREFAPEGEISVSHPRMSLEEFFLDVVAKAKADKTLTTAGAQSGGNIADYLKADAAPEDAENARILLEQLSSGTEQQEENISGSGVKPEAEKESSPAPALEILDNLNEKAEQPIGTEQAGSTEKPDLSAANDKLNDLLSHRDL